MKKIQAHLNKEIISTNDSFAKTLHQKSSFGEKIGEKIQYSLSEALYLVEKKKLINPVNTRFAIADSKSSSFDLNAP